MGTEELAGWYEIVDLDDGEASGTKDILVLAPVNVGIPELINLDPREVMKEEVTEVLVGVSRDVGLKDCCAVKEQLEIVQILKIL